MKIITRPFVEQAIVSLPVIHIVLCPVCHANVRVVPNALSLDTGIGHAVLGPINGDSISFPLLCPNGHKLVTRFCNMSTPSGPEGEPVDQTVLFVDQVCSDTEYVKAVEEIKQHKVDMIHAAEAAGATPLAGAPGFKVVKGVENVNKFLKSIGVNHLEKKDDVKDVPIKPLKIEEEDNTACECGQEKKDGVNPNSFDYNCDCQHCLAMKNEGFCLDCGGHLNELDTPGSPDSQPQRVQVGFALTEKIMDFYCRQISAMPIHKKAFSESVDKGIIREWILRRAHEITELKVAEIEKVATVRFQEMLKFNPLNYSIDDLPYIVEEEIATAVENNAEGIRLRLKEDGIWPVSKSK